MNDFYIHSAYLYIQGKKFYHRLASQPKSNEGDVHIQIAKGNIERVKTLALKLAIWCEVDRNVADSI